MSHTHDKQEHDSDSSKPLRINRPRLSGSGDQGFVTPVGSPTHQDHFLVPSPLVTRRTRTFSASRHATEGPVHYGICKYFSRQKGHGFIQAKEECPPDKKPELIFMHISDIESEYVPLPGDEVSFKKAKLPPKNEKFQAVEVRICKLDQGSGKLHERWDQPK